MYDLYLAWENDVKQTNSKKPGDITSCHSQLDLIFLLMSWSCEVLLLLVLEMHEKLSALALNLQHIHRENLTKMTEAQKKHRNDFIANIEVMTSDDYPAVVRKLWLFPMIYKNISCFI